MKKEDRVHFTHCYQGENENNCKYIDDDCPVKKAIKKELDKFRKIRQKAKEDYNKIVKPAYKDFLKKKEKIISQKYDRAVIIDKLNS